MLSKASITLLTSVVVSIGVIYYVHNQQEVERQQMHNGVIRDIERQQYRQKLKLERNKQIEDQQNIN